MPDIAYNEYDTPEGYMDAKTSKKQVGGTHYQLPIQPIEYITKNKLNYCQGNVIKYVTRYKDKNGSEDLLKAIQYIQFLLEDEYDIRLETY